MRENYMYYGGGDHQMADQGCVWLFGCRSKSVDASLDCGLGSTPALPQKKPLQLQYADCSTIKVPLPSKWLVTIFFSFWGSTLQIQCKLWHSSHETRQTYSSLFIKANFKYIYMLNMWKSIRTKT